ncbi:hypothetical protein BGZ57DRAFT_861006 [Hyaloscypha finlandica]|nr:hypothetical protein BGZ57DRAFT_861006 [Hyaloscypha finlandica]
MSATISLVAPIGPGNWPAGAALTNLSASARVRYTSKLTFMNAVEAINLSLPGYTGPATPFVARPRGRSAQIFQIYTAQYATTINRPYSNLHSFQSAWSHIKGEMFTLISRHSALVGPALPPAAPGPAVVNQQQHLPLVQPAQQPGPRTPLPSSRPNSAVVPVSEEEEEDESEDDGGEVADLRLLQVFGFRPLGNAFPGGN